ncbi:MAG: hypothetical protein Athens071412_793 [Parcubacteria group bacterium Athens0714_12]|nr:MAG: hypothetical protein Athens071412_793 [Parcubacteria group bacterium Athens0714_12]
MTIKQLSKFLVKAKINTYTSSGEGGEKVLPDGSKEFEFIEGKFKYRDRYFGLNFFVGEEIVWESGKIVWGMNYYGKIISQIVSPRQIYQFLQETLKRITENKPFRGPYRFKKDNFKYFNKIKGMVEKFEGEEMIFHKGISVYKLIYHGGIIKEK